MKKRIILHVDVNNAFLSWTAVDKLNKGEKVDIRNRYAVIGGDENARRGIVLAKSNLCKQKGVVTAEPLFQARKKCPYLEVYSGDYKLYRDFSNKMYNYLLKYTNIIERYSVDECFLDYTNSGELFGNPIKTAYQIKEDIKKQFGFTVNVGVGNNKLEAKMASDFSKPDQVHTLFDEEVKTKMWPLPIEDLFMLGKSSSKKLRELGINTIGELANQDINFLIKNFKSHGKLMWEYANGIDNSPVEFEYRDAKSISNSTVLPHDYKNREEIIKVLKELTLSVGKRLRKTGFYAKNVNIWLKYNDFKKVSKQMNIENSINTDDEIIHYVIILLDKLWDKTTPIRSLSVGVGNLSTSHDKQLSLFDNKEHTYKRKDLNDKLQKTIDEIKKKFGNDKIVYADMIEEKDVNKKNNNLHG